MHRRPIVVAIAVLAACTVAVAPASAKSKKHKPKPFHGSKEVTDTTPDPTGSLPGDTGYCTSSMPEQYPVEEPIKVTIPAPGKLKVALNNQLDWAIDILNSKNTSVGGVDGGNPDDVESTSVKIKKKGTYYIQACNLEGEPTVTVTWSYTPS